MEALSLLLIGLAGVILGFVLLALTRPFWVWFYNTKRLDEIYAELQAIRRELSRRESAIPDTEKAPESELPSK